MTEKTENAAKKRILVIGDDDLNYVLGSINEGLKNYRLLGLPLIPRRRELIEKELSGDGYYGVLVDELYTKDFLSKVEAGKKKYGIIKWCISDEGMGKIKTLNLGAAAPEDIEKELNKIFG